MSRLQHGSERRTVDTQGVSPLRSAQPWGRLFIFWPELLKEGQEIILDLYYQLFSIVLCVFFLFLSFRVLYQTTASLTSLPHLHTHFDYEFLSSWQSAFMSYPQFLTWDMIYHKCAISVFEVTPLSIFWSDSGLAIFIRILSPEHWFVLANAFYVCKIFL